MTTAETTQKLIEDLRGFTSNARLRDNKLRLAVADRLASLTAEVERLTGRLEHTQQWYAERLERLTDLGKERGCWPEMAAIIANGSSTRQLPDGSYHYDPPTYAQQLNRAKHRAEAAETRLSEATKRNVKLAEALEALIVAVEWEVPPIRDGVDTECRLDILTASARSARQALGGAPTEELRA